MSGGSEQPPVTPLICFWFLELLPDFVSQLFVDVEIELSVQIVLNALYGVLNVLADNM
jgi:hypothetical protein